MSEQLADGVPEWKKVENYVNIYKHSKSGDFVDQQMTKSLALFKPVHESLSCRCSSLEERPNSFLCTNSFK